MFMLSSLIVSLVTLLLANAAPASTSTSTDGQAFFCVDGNFTGSCDLFNYVSNECNNVPEGFNNDISSFTPYLTGACFAFIGENCTGLSLGPIAPPGVAQLGVEVPEFQDAINSFKCTSD